MIATEKALQPVVAALKFTSADLLVMPDDGKRYEVIEGELFMSRAAGYEHQYTCGRLFRFLDDWNDRAQLGVALESPGLVLGEDEDVIPDVVWMSHERFRESVDLAGHFTRAPELVIEVLSFGKHNILRDRQVKRKLYSRRGVQEYWIVDWYVRQLEIYRRNETHLELSATLFPNDQLTSPLLPGFACTVKALFFSFPETAQSLPTA